MLMFVCLRMDTKQFWDVIRATTITCIRDYRDKKNDDSKFIKDILNYGLS